MIAYLYSTYPCCKGKAVFKYFTNIPREIYERTCPKCHRKYEIVRTVLSITKTITVHELTWEILNISNKKG